MNTCINKFFLTTKQLNPKFKQWFWFGALWFLGLGTALLIALPIKLLIKACQ